MFEVFIMAQQVKLVVIGDEPRLSKEVRKQLAQTIKAYRDGILAYYPLNLTKRPYFVKQKKMLVKILRSMAADMKGY